MCGILGFNWDDEKLARKLGHLLKHRGPDGEGYYADENVTLGHRRLSIIDLSKKGMQPMSNHDKTCWITYNGEIFNYLALKEELKSLGYKFVSNTDTEVVLCGYSEWGYKVLDRLNGQFAFCIYDKTEKQLFLARDRLGINPLFYFFDGTKFIFGSELKVILRSGIDKEIHKQAFMHYVTFGYTPPSQSIIKSAFKLEPGHFMIFDLKERKIVCHERYWHLELTSEITDEKQAKKLILKQLDESVKARLMSDVPLGAFLSGGVDSSAVVAIASKYKKNLNTFSVKFEHQESDESEYSAIVSKLFGTKHHVVNFSADKIKQIMPELPLCYDDPFADPSMVPTILVSKAAREFVAVSLSGDGGDELFGGYTTYKNYVTLMNLQRLYPNSLNSFFDELLKNIASEKLKSFLEIGGLTDRQKYLRFTTYLNKSESLKVFGKDMSSLFELYSSHWTKDFLNTAINTDLHLYLPEDILQKVDRASMSQSLESRPPLLDHDMVNLSCRLSPSLKLKSGQGKLIFKKSLEGLLPKSIIYRKKKGFGFPLKHYLQNELRSLVQDYIIDFNKHSLFSESFIKYVSEIIDKKLWERNYSRLIWTVLMFNLWWETWMEK